MKLQIKGLLDEVVILQTTVDEAEKVFPFLLITIITFLSSFVPWLKTKWPLHYAPCNKNENRDLH
jgi:hypothetical protein